MKLKNHILLFIIVGIWLLPPMPTFAQAKRFDIEAAAKLVRLSDPNITPDGKSI
ncbi:MAG: hypothetical protein JNM09_31000, partial [Blastocatellia bacterium]|nr:hypothetical protein [Blastocatellia bacterium]